MLKYVNNVCIRIFNPTRNESTLVDDKKIFVATVDCNTGLIFFYQVINLDRKFV